MDKINVKLKMKYDTSLVKEMLDEFYSCRSAVKYIKSIGVPEEKIEPNITKIIDFVRDVKYCKKCPGVAKCKKENPLLQTRITYNNGIVDRQIAPCKRVLEQMEYDSQYEVRDFENGWLDGTIETLDISKNRLKAVKVYLDFKKGASDKWLYLTGNRNTGRSYVAAVITSDAARQKLGPICFLNTSLRLKELYDMSFKEKDKFKEYIDLYSECPILVLDDFGNEFKNDFMRDGVLLQILINRSAKKLFTIFTSDFTISEIGILYSTSRAGSIRAKQLANIITENTGGEISLGEISAY